MTKNQAIFGYYHQVRQANPDGTGNGLGVSPESLVGHARILERAGYALDTVSNAINSANRKVAALSFDDGYRDNLANAIPALAEMGAVGTIYVVTSEIGRDGPSWIDNDDGRARLLTASELRDVSAAGWEIGSHCNTHQRLTNLSSDQQREELHVSKSTLEQLLGMPVQSLCYPYGVYSDVTLQLAEEVGYDNAVTTAKRGGKASRYAVSRYSLGGYGKRAIKQNAKLRFAIARRRWAG